MGLRIGHGAVLAWLCTSSCLGPNPFFDGPVPQGDSDAAGGTGGLAETSSSGGGIPTGEGSTTGDGASGGPSDDPAPSGGGGEGDTSGGSAAINLVAAANGGVVERFTSEYCDPANLPDNCQPGRWIHTNINDGEYSFGYNDAAFEASWASGDRTGEQQPEAFEFTFAGGGSAVVETIVIQNYGEEGGAGPYYATHVVVKGRDPGGGSWSILLDVDVDPSEPPQTFDLGSTALVDTLRLEVTDSVHPQFWELGEFEAWGTLQ